MRFGSVCSGIEAASVAWHPLGWRAAWLAEIEPFPAAVLKHHYPDVPNLGDMKLLPDLIRLGDVEAPDLFCGGTPCQAFSVAGLRKSLDDARGNLSLTFCEIANAIDSVRRSRGEQPAVIFWENVPGVLSTADNAFGCFLAGLAGEDEPLIAPGGKWTDAGVVLGPTRAVAWRILDAQFFGLAQRRRRVFVVASARDGFDPAAILLEWDGVRRDTAPSREAGKVAPTIPSRSTAGGGLGTDFDCDGGVIVPPVAETLIASDHKGPGHNRDHNFVAHSLTASRSSTQCPNEDTTLVPVTFRADAMREGTAKTPSADAEGRVRLRDLGMGMYKDIAPTLDCGAAHGVAQPVTYDFFNITAPVNRQNREPGDPCHTLARSNAEHAVVMQPVAFQETADCLTSAYGTKWNGNASATNGSLFAAQPVAMRESGQGYWMQDDIAGTIDANMGMSGHANRPAVIKQPAMQVRRLTPVECERLQGFPDNYTAIPWRKRPADQCPDGPRYKALGNSWAVPVVRWIGRRINNAVFASGSNRLEVAA